jgi:Uma2 family endonuclease
VITAGTVDARRRAAWPLSSALPPMGADFSLPAIARGHVAVTLTSWQLSALTDAGEVIASELVTNAVKASTEPETKPVHILDQVPLVRLVLLSDGSRVLIKVFDQAGGQPVMKRVKGYAETGRGLLLVRTLSSQWGWYPVPGADFKCVWAELTRDGQPERRPFTLAPPPADHTDGGLLVSPGPRRETSWASWSASRRRGNAYRKRIQQNNYRRGPAMTAPRSGPRSGGSPHPGYLHVGRAVLFLAAVAVSLVIGPPVIVMVLVSRGLFVPEDGKGFELEDGWLIEVAASSRHNWALRTLARIIEHAAAEAGARVVVCDGGEWEISTPAGVRKPDVFVVPRETARAAIIEESPRLIPGTELYVVAEVISPGSGSERTERLRKVSEYARLGIPQYWIVGHTPRPSVQVLTDGTYTAAPAVMEGARLEAVIDADKPFTVSFDPADLLDF